jgi:hypothetical protein
MNKLPFINEVLKPLLNRTCLLKKLIVLVLMELGTFSLQSI